MQQHVSMDEQYVKYLRKNRRNSIWKRIVGSLACLVIFCTTYLLILPAITMEQDTFCGYEAHTHSEECYVAKLVCESEESEGHSHSEECFLPAHTHTEECYTPSEVLICELETSEGHAHDANCYITENPLICEIEESQGHTHGDDCYLTETPLTCTMEEAPGHTHGDGCYAETVSVLTCEDSGEEHTHSDDCYTLQGGELTCTLEETEGHTHGEDCYGEAVTSFACTLEESEGHIHSESCYGEAVESLACTLAETEGHTHGEDCYTIGENVLSCGMEERAEAEQICELEESEGHTHTDECYAVPEEADSAPLCELDEHTHELICYSDATADLETAEDWEKILANVELTGVWREDVLAIARSQMGYHESTKNYIVHEDGKTTMGYTRYGEWYGYPYGDWCAMFVSFCLDYAGVEGMPQGCGCQKWIETLSSEEYGLYRPAGSHDPQPGDLVFFDQDGDGTSDHVGLVSELTEAGEDTPAQIITVEGNYADRVCEVTRDLADETILGYAQLPQQLTDAEREQIEYVISLIDAMPSADEIDAMLAEFEEAEDYEGEEAWYTEVCQQVAYAYHCYSNLSDEQKAKVTNADKLLELEYIWSVTALAGLDTITVYQVNQYDDSTSTVLVHGGTVQEVFGTTMDFAWWTAVIVEEKSDGQLYVSQIVSPGDGVAKFSCGANTDNGFVLMVHTDTATVDTQVGDPVTVTFPYQTDAYSASGLGTVNFGDYLKPRKDNTGKLTTAESADTLELIEVNLYDFGSNINDLYNSNTKYPGFQQDSGTLTVGSILGAGSFNFGNNITSDLAAGIESLTNKGGDINATASTYGGTGYGVANIPLENTISKTLLNGYPALADGTSLDYLFSTGTYATKQNTANINGLFRYNSTTGTYTFNSRENHAQFDASTNTFTLYDQIISSNFIMYPFGNFLPFNDITKLSAQASTIDRSYFVAMADSAGYRYNQGAGDEYGTLSTQLDNFISLMDSNYGSNWDGYDAVNAYFDVRNIPQSFSETNPKLPNGDPLMDYVYSIDFDEATDFFFSMEMKMNFMQPKDGLTGLTGNEEMGFYFTGDDDVWIYVDGALFLDLSGIHRHVGGEIDFVNGKIHYYNLDVTTGDVATTPYKTVTFEEAFREAYAADSTLLEAALATLNDKGTFKNYSTHSFSFYYMERGAGSGVCRMNFNFPLLRQNTLSVEKELTADTDIKALGNPDFKFQVLDVDANGNKTDDSFFPKFDSAGAQWAYSLYDVDGKPIQEVKVTDKNPDGTVKTLEVYNAAGQLVRKETDDEDGNAVITNYPENGSVLTIDENGIFTLKAGQRAEFIGISENWGKYYVRELIDPAIVEQYGTITVDGNVSSHVGNISVGSQNFKGFDSPILDMSNGSTRFLFNNKITSAKLGNLSIRKDLDATYSGITDKTFKFSVTLDGQPLPAGTTYTVGSTAKTVVVEDGVSYVEIKGGETAVISKILAGTKFEVAESAASAAGYVVSYTVDGAAQETAASGTIGLKQTVAVVVKNSEQGAPLQIPVTKSYYQFGTVERISHFNLVQVIDATGMNTVGDAISASITVVDAAVTKDALFTLNYSEQNVDFGDSDTLVFYYRLTEDNTQLPNSTLPNYQVYVYEVTVTKSSDGMSAEISGMWSGTADESGVPTGDLTKLETLSAEFTNTLAGSLALEKQVVGTTPEEGFSFTIALDVGTSGLEALPTQYAATYYRQDGSVVPTTVSLNEEKIILNGFMAGEKAVIQGIPYGATWTITETTTDGYIVTHAVDGTEGSGETSTGAIVMGTTSVVFTNTQTYVLPETGGPGTYLYTAVGFLLVLCGAALLLYNLKKRGREAF